MPVRLIDATAGCIDSHLFGRVDAPVKADCYDTELIVAEMLRALIATFSSRFLVMIGQT